MAIGRISGPLLKANLIRDGVDLAFETNLLYLDVNNKRIGINLPTAPSQVLPEYDLDVNGTTRTSNLIVDSQSQIASFTISGNSITSSNPTINFIPASGQATIYHSKVQISSIDITGNIISTNTTNANLELRPNGSGIVDVYSNTRVNGNLQVTGNVSAGGDVIIGGNITIGDSLTDTITINASIKSNLIPEDDNTYDLGSVDYSWRNIYGINFVTDNLSLDMLDIGNLMFRDNEITTTTGFNLSLTGNGAGGVSLGNFRFRDNVITNISNNAISQLVSTGDGYFKIEGTNGFVLPRGTNAERPTGYAVLGMARYNTESRAIEVWDGFSWASPSGSTGAISEAQANDISAAYAIMLG